LGHQANVYNFVNKLENVINYPYRSCLLLAISSSSTARDFPFRAAALVAALKRRCSISSI